ncbi:C-type lectin domain-containing protein [Pedosphaera parvula]|uniref:C-type lectin domain protein n=1 Tax=Pedosphaera parvula (strain Ellin514) TaxID=320771 RepID=B9XMI4_PEDPL|nr:C-type lectin domain-containing protein [Pedosphaera parvula]EEF59026.1 C-type lectin domain protein [Pedosphaera parvula Ellin514]
MPPWTTKLLFLLSFTLVHLAAADPISQRTTNSSNNHIYILLNASTWTDAEAEAVALGGHLATIRNQAEEDWIFHTFGSYDNTQRLLWIGLSDRDRKSHFTWSSGESVSYTAWAPGEPNNVGSGEDYAAIFYPNHSQRNKWNDWDNRTSDPIGLPMNGVVEIIPPPPILAANKTTAGTLATTGKPATSNATGTAGIQPNLVPVEITPAVTITNVQGAVQLYWPISAAGYTLEATTNLAQPFTMFGYSEATNTALGIITVTITNPGDQMFFRLHKP